MFWFGFKLLKTFIRKTKKQPNKLRLLDIRRGFWEVFLKFENNLVFAFKSKNYIEQCDKLCF